MSKTGNDIRNWTIGGGAAAFIFFLLDKGGDALVSNYLTKEVTDGLGSTVSSFLGSSSVPNWIAILFVMAGLAAGAFFWWREINRPATKSAAEAEAANKRAAAAIQELEERLADSELLLSHASMSAASAKEELTLEVKRLKEKNQAQCDLIQSVEAELQAATDALKKSESLNKKLMADKEKAEQAANTLQSQTSVLLDDLERIKNAESMKDFFDTALSARANGRARLIEDFEKRLLKKRPLLASVKNASLHDLSEVLAPELTGKERMVLKEAIRFHDLGKTISASQLNKRLNLEYKDLDSVLQALVKRGALLISVEDNLIEDEYIPAPGAESRFLD